MVCVQNDEEGVNKYTGEDFCELYYGKKNKTQTVNTPHSHPEGYSGSIYTAVASIFKNVNKKNKIINRLFTDLKDDR